VIASYYRHHYFIIAPLSAWLDFDWTLMTLASCEMQWSHVMLLFEVDALRLAEASAVNDDFFVALVTACGIHPNQTRIQRPCAHRLAPSRWCQLS
jgi:hypothetical protein